MAPVEVDVENEDLVRKRPLSAETEIVRVEVQGGRRGANNDAETSVQKRLLFSRNIRHKVSSTHRSRHVPTGGRGRRAYKRHVLRARTAEGLKIRRRTLPYRSHTQDEEERRRSRRIPRFVDGFPEQVQFLGFGSREAVKMSRFAVTLPFNCLMDYYKYNTAAQYLGTGQPLSDVSVDTHHVECVDNFTYLGSVQSSDGYCRPDIRDVYKLQFF